MTRKKNSTPFTEKQSSVRHTVVLFVQACVCVCVCVRECACMRECLSVCVTNNLTAAVGKVSDVAKHEI